VTDPLEPIGWLDEIEAQLDSTVPHYVPRLIAEIRRLSGQRKPFKLDVSKEWCERMANLEEGHDVSAGSLSALGGRPETSQQDAERRAIGNCYMMAKREIARLLNSRDVIDEKSLERWQHVLRFCESVGCKSDILRWQIPTELTEGGRPETGPEHRCGVRGFAESGDQCPACHVPGGRHAPLQEQP